MEEQYKYFLNYLRQIKENPQFSEEFKKLFEQMPTSFEEAKESYELYNWLLPADIDAQVATVMNYIKVDRNKLSEKEYIIVEKTIKVNLEFLSKLILE